VLRAYMLGSRAAVIYSPVDLSVSLLGTNVWNCRGYEGDGAVRILRNLLMYARLPSSEKARIAIP
jgi:hypothetical protein